MVVTGATLQTVAWAMIGPNDMGRADILSPMDDHGFRHLLLPYKQIQHKKIEEERCKKWAAGGHSRHLKRID